MTRHDDDDHARRREATHLDDRVRLAESGQATVELVALLPLFVLLGFALFCVLAAARVDELAGQAAQAGAIALLQQREPQAAARAALPGIRREDVEIVVAGRRVRVTLRPHLPLASLERRLSATATAHAGPESTP